ncbi:hypothetical protein, partial [Aeromonas hydrophila]|uniref:hypothetical protein n=1 Tax=Aeromonas hydrophila TaxID=644 RepID=UPI00403950F0
PKVGRSKTYILSRQFGWKGTVSNHKKALRNGLSIIQGLDLLGGELTVSPHFSRLTSRPE